MSVTFEKTAYDGRAQALWRGEAKMLPNGYTCANAIAVGTNLLRGTLVYIDPDTQSGAVIKVAKILGGTTTAVQVEKGSYIQAGDVIMVLGGSASQTVTSVDTSGSDYDVVNFSTALTGADEVGAYLIESDGEDTPAAAYLPNAVLGADRLIEKNDLVALDVAYDAVVLKNVIPSFPTAWLGDGGLVLKNNPKIIFIHS